jgi:erythromycin esterase-like protein
MASSITPQIAEAALPLHDDASLDPLMAAIGNARFVLIGEASHGTHEFYTWRARLSRRLISEKGFHFVAVEGDWPDCFALNCWAKGYAGNDPAAMVLYEFQRWPTWMWANWEVSAFLEWLKKYNNNLQDADKVGFYGLDMYSLYESLDAVVKYFKDKDPETARAVSEAFQCFEPYNKDIYRYARNAHVVPSNCEDEVVEMLLAISRRPPADGSLNQKESAFNAEQNARVAVNAEQYYRRMVRGGNVTWNIRDTHMMETLNNLMELYGPEAKAIVWEHNTHIGDARYTDMASEGMVNIGQLTRLQHGEENVRLIGFSSYSGTVIAGAEWDAEMEVMQVPEGRSQTWEWLLHHGMQGNGMLLMEPFRNSPVWMEERGHRAIGVVYHPEYERFGNYVSTILPRRYDALLHIDQSRALHPLHIKNAGSGPPELYPFGV